MDYTMVVAIITLGFDITHALLTITNYHPLELVVLLARVNGLNERSKVAYNSLEQVANAMRIDVKGYEVDITNVEKAVDEIRRLLEHYARKYPLVIDIGGGMRLLIFEVLLAYMSLPSSLKESIKIVIYIEGKNKSIELSSSDVNKLLTTKKALKLKEIEKTILKNMETRREYKLVDIHKTLTEKGIKVTKQYVHKILKKLEDEGLVEKISRGVYIKNRDTLIE